MSKFVSDSVEVLLPYSIITPEFGMEDIEHKSIITGKRNYIRAKDKTDYLVTDYLFKYADPLARLSELRTYENTIVELYPNDESVFSVTGDPAGYYLEVIEPFYLDTTTRFGACNMIFRAIDANSAPLSGYGFSYGANYGVNL